jgi:hypothetical protein
MTIRVSCTSERLPSRSQIIFFNQVASSPKLPCGAVGQERNPSPDPTLELSEIDSGTVCRIKTPVATEVQTALKPGQPR